MKDRHDLDRPIPRRSPRPASGRFTGFPAFGYLRPFGAKAIGDFRKDPAAEAILDEWFHRLEAAEGCHRLAAWLNTAGVPLRSPIEGHLRLPEMRDRANELAKWIDSIRDNLAGGRRDDEKMEAMIASVRLDLEEVEAEIRTIESARRPGCWTVAKVAAITHNPLLKGVMVVRISVLIDAPAARPSDEAWRSRTALIKSLHAQGMSIPCIADKLHLSFTRVSRSLHGRGRRSDRVWSEQPSELPYPHLKFIEPERYDRIIALTV